MRGHDPFRSGVILGSLHKITQGPVEHTRNTTGRVSPSPPAMRMWDDVPCLGGWRWGGVGCSGFRGLSSGGGWSRAWSKSLALPAARGVCSHTSPPRGAPNCIRACSCTCTHSRIQMCGRTLTCVRGWDMRVKFDIRKAVVHENKQPLAVRRGRKEALSRAVLARD